MEAFNNSSGSFEDPDAKFGESGSEGESVEPSNSDNDKELLRRIQNWWYQAQESQIENRVQMAIDRDFYDGFQWDEEDALELKERGQAPLVFNYVKTSIDWILGTERKTRLDWRVYPRKDSQEANKDALNKTKLLKYVSDVNKTVYARSMAFADSVIDGLGWLEDGIKNDETDEIIMSRYESWRNMWYDHLSIEKDMSDARFVFRKKYVDLDVAKAMFPGKEAVLNQAAIAHDQLGEYDSDDDYWLAQMYTATDAQGRSIGGRSYTNESYLVNNRRKRVKLIECWYREPVSVKIMRGYDNEFSGSEYNELNESHQQAVAEEIVSVHDAVVMKVKLCIFTENFLLHKQDSPYNHNRFPFTPVWAFRRGRDNAPYGAVRMARDPQSDLNKRYSKALFIMSTNQIIADKDITDDWDDLIDEASRPDGVIQLRPGSANKRFEMNTDRQLAEEHLMLMDKDADYITRVSGVTDENLGQQTNAVSGKAIRAKQEEGGVVTYALFDNLRYAMQIQGEKQLSLCEQFIDMPKEIRIIGDNAKHEFTALNQPYPNPVTGEIEFLNDITKNKADFIVDAQDFRQSVRQAMFESMMQLLEDMPGEMAMQLLDMVVEMSDVPNKENIVQRIRSINGQIDPDREETPEEQQDRMAREEQQAADQKLERDHLQSQVDERKARTEKLKLEAIQQASEATAIMLSMPDAAPSTDILLDSAGFESHRDITGIEGAAPQPGPNATAQAQEYLNPSPKMDPNKAMQVDASKEIAKTKSTQDKKKAASKKKAQSKKKPKKIPKKK